MRIYLLFIVFLTLLNGKPINQKLIISSSTDKNSIDIMLLKTKILLLEDKNIIELKKRYDFQINTEKIGTFYALVAKPISSIEMRKKLTLALAPISKNIFYINVKKPITLTDTASPKKRNLIEVIGLQWVVLLLLSFLGLMASIINRRKLRILNQMQENINKNQIKMEYQIKGLRGKK